LMPLTGSSSHNTSPASFLTSPSIWPEAKILLRILAIQILNFPL
jgi:hypothetical protein